MEATQALIDHAIATDKVRLITVSHFVDNPASKRVIDKLDIRHVAFDSANCVALGSKVNLVH